MAEDVKPEEQTTKDIEPAKDPLGWKPGNNFIIEVDDKTAEPRTLEQLEAMVAEIRVVANKYDFDLYAYGAKPVYEKGQAAIRRARAREALERMKAKKASGAGE